MRKFFQKTGFSLWSWRYLVHRLIRVSWIENQEDIKILELGAGSGIVTREIQKTLKKGSNLTVFEIQDEMIRELRKLEKDNTRIIQASVENIHEYCTPNSIDVIISTLPLWSMDKEMVDHVLDEISQVLKKDGVYIQYQYALQNLQQIRTRFTLEKLQYEPRNFWPAFIYIAHKK